MVVMQSQRMNDRLLRASVAVRTSNMKISRRRLPVKKLASKKIALRSVPHVQHDYFSSFNQSNHWFVTSLPSCISYTPSFYAGNLILVNFFFWYQIFVFHFPTDTAPQNLYELNLSFLKNKKLEKTIDRTKFNVSIRHHSHDPLMLVKAIIINYNTMKITIIR